MLDENVPAPVADLLVATGHQASFIRDYIPPGSTDPLVATVAETLDAMLVSFDGDFQKIAPRIPHGQRARFRRLSRIWMRCWETEAEQRLRNLLALVVSEHATAQAGPTGRIIIWVGSSYIRIER